MAILRAALLAALILWPTVSPVAADDVTLTSRDGALEISGTLLGFDGEFYRVDTEFGILTVDGSGVNCEGPGCPMLGAYKARFTLSGASSMGEVLIPAMIEGFALNGGYALTRETLPGTGLLYRLFEKVEGIETAEITVRLTSSAEGFADLVSEQADIVLSTREVSSQERALVGDAGLGDLRGLRQFRVIARDALVPIVAPGNPVRRLTMNELAAVYSGQITRWSDLGGEDAPITLHLTHPGDDLGQLFLSRVLAPQGLPLAPDLRHHGTVRGLVAAVAEDPFGIGVSTFSQSGLADVVTLTGECSFEVVASEASIKAGDYPLTAPMYLYLPARRLPKIARDFLAYMRSGSAQLVTRRVGFVDQAFTEVPVAAQGRRFANAIRAAGPEVTLEELQRMMSLLDGKGRISLTFRFQGGSTLLDAPSRAFLALLASALEAGEFDGRRLTFVGFSDSEGAAEANRKLSQRRADAVLSAVLAETEVFDRSRVTLATDGFGEALPMACDDTAWGRHVNRRVEIWVD